MAESSFDAGAYHARLTTLRLGRPLVALAEAGSTNDVAWEASATGAHGRVVVADAQVRGRGRAGRTWHTAAGKGLALSLLLREGLDCRPIGVMPLAVGVALARALGSRVRLKWPNDVLIGDAKVAGVLVEGRTAGDGDLLTGAAPAPRGIVIGVGVNVSQREEDFPPELRDRGAARRATSLALEGNAATREEVAADLLNAFEPLWDDLATRGAAPVISAWEALAAFRGERVVASTPSGEVRGIQRSLDAEGRLVLELDGGGTAVITAGDVDRYARDEGGGLRGGTSIAPAGLGSARRSDPRAGA